MKDFTIVLTAIIVFCIALILIPWLTKSLWNLLMPEIFGFKQINTLQALGLIVLYGLLSTLRILK